MLIRSQLLLSLLSLVFLNGCGNDDKIEPKAPAPRTPLALNTVGDILGSWQQCNNQDDVRSSAGIYTFNADGTLKFESAQYTKADCKGDKTVYVVLSGSFVVGPENALDLSFGVQDDITTQYRVFSVKGTQLSISNNPVVGGVASDRDMDLNEDALKLEKVSE